MKAIQVHEFGGPEVLQIHEVDVPQPSDGEVLVKIGAAGVNPYDTYTRTGSYGARNPGERPARLKRVHSVIADARAG